jgi:CheY-like chemotaxis protein
MSSSQEQPFDSGASLNNTLLAHGKLHARRIDRAQDGDIAPTQTGMDHTTPHHAQPPLSTSLRVLLVDDHEDMLGLMKMMMERRSYRVEIALSGAEALAVAQGFGPQVVVSDIGMPGMDGYEMMQALRSMQALPPFKSIALSGYDASEEEPRARAAGYDAQLTKPVDFDALFRAIDSLATAAR